MLTKLIAAFLTVFISVGTVNCADDLQNNAKTASELHVLFIGNSFTYGNDLPKMLATLANAGNQAPLIHKSQTPGGCSFEKHWKDGKALAQIQAAQWDFVILQEQSQMPLLNRESMIAYGKKLDAEINKQGATTILYMTWARQDKPEQQKGISAAYQELGEVIKAQVAPVGLAWETALSKDKSLVLHAKDKKHPSKAGTYLAACVFYATIYEKSPEGLPGEPGDLTDEEARPLQAIAWETVQSLAKKL